MINKPITYPFFSAAKGSTGALAFGGSSGSAAWKKNNCLLKTTLEPPKTQAYKILCYRKWWIFTNNLSFEKIAPITSEWLEDVYLLY